MSLKLMWRRMCNVRRVAVLRSTTDTAYCCISQFLRKLSHSLKSSLLFERNYCSQLLQSLLLTLLCRSFLSFFHSFSFSSSEIPFVECISHVLNRFVQFFKRRNWAIFLSGNSKTVHFMHLSVGSMETSICLFTIFFKFSKKFSLVFEDIIKSPFFDKNMHQFSSHLTFEYAFFFPSK